ncbi:DUF3267 domain-containing protein [bacterium LRH843]|nr:DUF3267 domain-containing protein [bacterium LRH843]
MNCWKSISISHDYGTLRLVIYSGCTMLFTFFIHYLLISAFIKPTELPNISFLFFIGSILSLVVFHKIFHLVPIWLCGKKALIHVERGAFVPSIKIPIPVTRKLYLVSLITPLFVVIIACALFAILFPTYFAYISIMSSIHFGLAFSDFVHISILLKAPKKSYVETYSDGFHILLKQSA